MCFSTLKVSYCMDCGKELKMPKAKRCSSCSTLHTVKKRRKCPKCLAELICKSKGVI